MEKINNALFSQTLEVGKNIISLFFHFWPLSQDIDD